MICPICNKEFKPTATKKVFCSATCRKTHSKRIMKHIPTLQICENCGDVFEAVEIKKYCSAECSLIAKQRKAMADITSSDKLSQTLMYCKEQGLSYAEYQKRRTLSKLLPISKS